MGQGVYKIKRSLRSIYGKLTRPLHHFRFITKMKKKDFTIHFAHEGNTPVRIPNLKYSDIFLKRKLTDKCRVFSGRVNAEPLLRKVVYKLYQGGFIAPHNSIVDIGAWLSDNSVVWANFLTNDAKVVAIDPSSKNLDFGRMLAKQNQLDNLRFVQAVCTNISGENMQFSGNIEHTSFSKNSNSTFESSGIPSTTIDDILAGESVGLIHLDVEGLELEVAQGAKQTIKNSQPIIIFEQHLLEDNPQEIFEYLRGFKYTILMINEILPQSKLDCRNFLAYPETFPIDDFLKHVSDIQLEAPIMPTSLGSPLLET